MYCWQNSQPNNIMCSTDRAGDLLSVSFVYKSVVKWILKATFVIQKKMWNMTIVNDDSIHILVKQHENDYSKLFWICVSIMIEL